MTYTPRTCGKADDILLNNFQIKKKRFKVLFNCDHIVWERSDAKRNQTKDDGHNEKKPVSAAVAATAASAAGPAAIQKGTEYEKEHLSQASAYGGLSNFLHLQDVIRVSKGATKSASIRNAHKPLEPNEVLESQQVTTPTEQYLSIYYGERIVASPTDCNRWQVRRLTLHNNDPYIVAKWYDHFHKLLRSDPNKRRLQRLLIFINPYGGRKMGLQVYERSCKQIIQLAGIDASCIITQRANQIRDILVTHDLTPYDAVCCVGGDGTVAEMINGLLLRAMKDHGLDVRKPEYIPKPALPVAIIPAGSTDTIVYSLHGTSDAQTAAIHLVLGQSRGLDVCSVRNRDGIIRFCTSVMGYGYLGDVAAKSEKYRWMGTKRYEYTGVKTFLLNRGYEAEIHLLLNEDETDAKASTSTISPPYNDLICHAGCQKCKYHDALQTSSNDDERPSSSNISLCPTLNNNGDTSTPEDLLGNDEEHSRNFNRNICDKNYTMPIEKQTQIDDLIDSQEPITKPSTPTSSSSSINVKQQQEQQKQMENTECVTTSTDAGKWRVIRGEFFMITGANITCACTRSPNGISRYCHLGDGHLDVVLVRKTNLFNNIRFVINTMGRDGDVRNLPFVEIYRTRQFMFKIRANSWPQDYNSVSGSCQPINETCTEEDVAAAEKLYSSWNCDGEVVNDLEITMISHRQLLDVFMRGPYIYSKPAARNKGKRSLFCCCCN